MSESARKRQKVSDSPKLDVDQVISDLLMFQGSQKEGEPKYTSHVMTTDKSMGV